MSEKLIKLGIERDIEYLYFIRNGDVWRIPRKGNGSPRHPTLIMKCDVEPSDNYVLYLDADGDLHRVAKKKSKRTKASKLPR